MQIFVITQKSQLFCLVKKENFNTVILFSCWIVYLIGLYIQCQLFFLSAVCSRCVAVSAATSHANVAWIFSVVTVLDSTDYHLILETGCDGRKLGRICYVMSLCFYSLQFSITTCDICYVSSII